MNRFTVLLLAVACLPACASTQREPTARDIDAACLASGHYTDWLERDVQLRACRKKLQEQAQPAKKLPSLSDAKAGFA